MTTTILYPGTFDPITNGHIDLITRARKIFDKVIVAIAKDTQKTSLFSQEERVKLAKKAIGDIATVPANISVLPFAGFVVDFAKEQQAQAILRGLRAVSDFEYELQLAGVNRQLSPNIETIFMPPSEQLSYVSSSMVRWIAELGGDVSPFVPKHVAKALANVYS